MLTFPILITIFYGIIFMVCEKKEFPYVLIGGSFIIFTSWWCFTHPHSTSGMVMAIIVSVMSGFPLFKDNDHPFTTLSVVGFVVCSAWLPWSLA